MTDPFFQLWFAVRYVHVASAALLAGGALMVAAMWLQAGASIDSGAAYAAARAYEWIFWSAIAVTVATGVSNLGLKGDGLLGPSTGWGSMLTAKLVAVFLLLAGSSVRSDLVIRSAGAAPTRRIRTLVAAFYGATSAIVLVALWIGLGLAHGRY